MENKTEKNWGAERGREPDVNECDEIIFDECGRIVENIDHRSHWFRLVKSKKGYGFGYKLLVKHGGGQEEITDWSVGKLVSPLSVLDSDNRYLLMYAIHSAWRVGLKEGRDKTAATYRNAFVEGRLKKRKMPKRPEIKVWIESKPYVPS